MLSHMKKQSILQNQVFLFFILSSLAGCAQYVSRFLFDIWFKGLDSIVSIWPFGKQALGSLLAFLLSNIIAKVLSYILNRKKTFKADNNVASSLAIYIVMVVLLIIVETIIGTPLQNWIYALLGGTYEGQSLTTATVSDQVLYQICGTLSPMLYGIGDCVIVFLMDKYVIMKRSEGLKE
jgi:putative flippase GtrA